MMKEELKPFVAGFHLAGKRLKNGKLQSYGLQEGLMDDFPEEVELFGNTYTLEEVVSGKEGYVCGVYV